MIFATTLEMNEVITVGNVGKFSRTSTTCEKLT